MIPLRATPRAVIQPLSTPQPQTLYSTQNAAPGLFDPRRGSKCTTPAEFYPHPIPRRRPTRSLNSLQALGARRDMGSSHDQNATCCGKENLTGRRRFRGRRVAEESGGDRSSSQLPRTLARRALLAQLKLLNCHPVTQAAGRSTIIWGATGPRSPLRRSRTRCAPLFPRLRNQRAPQG